MYSASLRKVVRKVSARPGFQNQPTFPQYATLAPVILTTSVYCVPTPMLPVIKPRLYSVNHPWDFILETKTGVGTTEIYGNPLPFHKETTFVIGYLLKMSLLCLTLEPLTVDLMQEAS